MGQYCDGNSSELRNTKENIYSNNILSTALDII